MILLTGATGKVGGELAKLVAGKGLAARALVRNGEQASSLRALGIEVVVGDLDSSDTLRNALQGVERAFFLPANGPEQVAQGAGFIKAAKAAGVQHVVKISGFLPDADSPNANARRHWQTNETLKASGLGWTLLRPNFYMQNLLMFVREIGEHQRFGLNAGDAACGMIHVRDVAAVAAECLADDRQIGCNLALTGPAAVTFAEVAKALSAVTGRDISYVSMSDDAFRREMLAQGVSDDTAAALTETYKGVGEGLFSAVTDTVRQITGSPATPFSEYAAEMATSLFRGSSSRDHLT